MCIECRTYPCHPRCPNAPEPPVIGLCCRCGEEIHEGDEIYDVNDERWCESCIDDCRTTAELDEFDDY